MLNVCYIELNLVYFIKNWLILMMNKKFCLYISGALCFAFFSSMAFASEDSVPYMYGGAVNYEQLEMVNAQMSKTKPEFEQGDIFGADTFDIGDETPVLPPENKQEDITSGTELPSSNATPEVPMLQADSDSQKEQKLPEKELNQESLSENFSDTDVAEENAFAGEENLLLSEETADAGNKQTWIDKISSEKALSKFKDLSSGEDSLEDLVDKARSGTNKRSNASVFDISGLMLRMTLKQVDGIMQNRGFKKVMERLEIPNFIKWRNEEKCRNSGVVGYERLEACVIQKAKEDKHQYVQHTKYAKYDTKEEIEVFFTSNFTDNKAYKIMYQSMASALTGNSPKAMYLYNIKVYDFWRRINRKYGVPDNKQMVTWGLGNGKAYLKAKTGELVLEDPMFRELDYTRMSREDQRYLATDLYSF